MGQVAAYLPEILAAGGQIGAAGLSGALAPDPYQKRQSFGNTSSISAGNWLQELQSLLHMVMPNAIGRANAGADLRDLMPGGHSLPSFSGGGLPMRIGASSDIRPPAAANTTPQFGTGSDQGMGAPVRAGRMGPSSLTAGPAMDQGMVSGPQRVGARTDMGTGADMGIGEAPQGDTQAHGAAQLLLHALSGGSRGRPMLAAA